MIYIYIYRHKDYLKIGLTFVVLFCLPWEIIVNWWIYLRGTILHLPPVKNSFCPPSPDGDFQKKSFCKFLLSNLNFSNLNFYFVLIDNKCCRYLDSLQKSPLMSNQNFFSSIFFPFWTTVHWGKIQILLKKAFN